MALQALLEQRARARLRITGPAAPRVRHRVSPTCAHRRPARTSGRAATTLVTGKRSSGAPTRALASRLAAAGVHSCRPGVVQVENRALGFRSGLFSWCRSDGHVVQVVLPDRPPHSLAEMPDMASTLPHPCGAAVHPTTRPPDDESDRRLPGPARIGPPRGAAHACRDRHPGGRGSSSGSCVSRRPTDKEITRPSTAKPRSQPVLTLGHESSVSWRKSAGA